MSSPIIRPTAAFPRGAGGRIGGRRIKLRAAGLVVALMAAMLTFGGAPARADTHTQANDDARSGWYGDQPGLSPQSVTSGSFGQLFKATVDGAVFAQPLVADHTLIVATENDNAYGLDPRTGAQIWSRNFGTPFAIQQDPHLAPCTDIIPNIGVTSTPVVDAVNHVVYMTSKVMDNGVPQYDMHKLSIATGAEQPGFPVRIGGVADNDPTHTFVAEHELQRPGLLLLNGVVYAAFGSHCVINPYEGWIFGVSSTGTTTARWTDQAGHPQSGNLGGGIWMSGTGLVSDGPGQIVFATGAPGLSATTPTPGNQPPNELGQSVVRLSVQGDGTLKPTDFFEPENGPALGSTDTDVGSGGVIGLPSQPFSTAAHPNLFMQVGKSGQLYLLDAGNLGGFQQGANQTDAVVRRLQDNGVWGKPTAWPGDGGWVYLTSAGGSKGPGIFEAMKWGLDANGVPNMTVLGQSTDQFGFGSSSASVSSDGTQSGSALVWVVWIPVDAASSGNGAQLRAYNPVPVNGTMQMVGSWPVGYGTKFAPPTIDNNTVYVPTRDGHVIGFGSPVATPMTAGGVTFASTVIGQSDQHSETFTAKAPLTVTSIQTTGPFQAGTPSVPLNTQLAADQTFTVPVTFAPTVAGSSAGSIAVTTSEGVVTFPLSGTGLSPGPDLVSFPTTADFGRVAVSSTGTKSIILTNQGAQPATISGADVPGAPFTVTGIPVTGATVASGQSITVGITYAPTAIESDDATLEINSNGGDLDVPFTAAGASPPLMSLSSDALPNGTVHFGNVPLGATLFQTVIMQNIGGVPMTMEKSKPPINSDGFTAVAPIGEGVGVAAGLPVTMRVNFTATALGVHSATWLLAGNDTTGRHTITYDATVVEGPAPRLSVNEAQTTLPIAGDVSLPFTVKMTRASSTPVTVGYATKDGTMVAGSGYDPVSGTLTFAPGETSKTVSVTVHGALLPSARTFTLNLKSPTGGAVIEDGQAKGYLDNIILYGSLIAENATTPRPADGSAAQVAFRVVMNNLPAGRSATVVASTSDGTLIAANGDYTPVSTTLTFTSNGAQTVTVPVAHLPAAGTNGTIFLNLSGASDGAKVADAKATGTVVGGTAPLPSIYTDGVSVARGAAGNTVAATFTTRLSAPSATIVQVIVTTGTDAVFKPGVDYVPVLGQTLTFQPGETTQTWTVPILGSDLSSGTNSVPVSITRPAHAIVGNTGAKAWVVSPTRRALLAPNSVVGLVSPFEASTIAVPISVVTPVNVATTVTATTADGSAVAGTDYTATTSAVTIAAGSTSANLLVPVKAGNPASPRTFTVTLSGYGNALLMNGTATVTLVGTSGATIPTPSVAPAFTAASPPVGGPSGTAFNYRFSASGFPAATYSIASGSLPPGLTLDPTGLLAGRANTPGTYSWTVQASNGTNPSATTSTFTTTITGGQAAALTAASPPRSATAGTGYSYAFTATGTPAPAFAVASGQVPTGLTLHSSGVLDGTPTTAGSFTFTVTATNSVGTDTSPSITIVVSPRTVAPVITAAAPPSATAGTGYSYTFGASGSPTPTWALNSGQLPAGLLLSSGGVLSGTPTTAGTSTFTLVAANGISPAATTGSLTVTVAAQPIAPQFTAAQPPSTAAVGTSYGYQFRASGTPAPTFSVQTGQMPGGLSLDPVSGQLSGVPTTAGTFIFKVQASNGVGTPASTANLTVTVSAGPPPSTDMQMVFTGPITVKSGTAGVYGLAAKNVGPISAVNNTMTLSLPSSAVVGPLPAGVTKVGDSLVYQAGTITPAHNAKFSVSITLPSTQTLTASVTSSTPDPDTSNNSVTITTTVR